MPVPEATIYENSRPPPGQDDIGSSRQASVVNQKAETQGVESLTDYHFRFCVFASDASHHAASDFWSHHVNHRLQPRAFQSVYP